MTYNDREGVTQCKNCPFGTYSNIIRATHCLSCHPLCQTCSGPSNKECSSCIESTGAMIEATICDCPEDSYYSSSDNRCIPCHPFCLGCSDSPDRCNECNTDISYRVEAEYLYCVDYCEDGYYREGTTCECIFYSIIL